MSTVNAIVVTVAALVAAAAGIGSWVAGHRTARSSERIERATAHVAAIEQGRRQDELTPRFELTWAKMNGNDEARSVIVVKLIGPDGLDRLDRIRIAVRNDDLDHSPRPGGGKDAPTPEELGDTVWGGWCFTPSVDGAPPNGRTVAEFSLIRGAGRRFVMVRTMTPRWMTASGQFDGWNRQYADAPVRLSIVCERDGHSQWVVPVEWPKDQRLEGVSLRV